MKYQNIIKEELKNKVAQDYFWLYDCSKRIGNVDFCVCMYQSQKELFEQESLLWAEAKKGSSDIYKSIVQLILTIGKARTFYKFLPPAMLGAFDGEKIAFIPYSDFFDIFCDLAITHYRRVKADAEKRIKSIEQFKDGGFQNFRFIR